MGRLFSGGGRRREEAFSHRVGEPAAKLRLASRVRMTNEETPGASEGRVDNRSDMMRALFLSAAALTLSACSSTLAGQGTAHQPLPVLQAQRAPLPVTNLSIDAFHQAMSRGEVSCRDIVQTYLDRIAAYDRQGPSLNSLITVNPAALERADELDRIYFSTGRMQGPLHCVPVAVKDNIDTVDMPTTAGSIVLKDSRPMADAFIVARIREAGGVILAKANLDEFAFGYGGASAVGGQVRNAYILSNSPGGSSSGTGAAIAGGLAMVGLGTDTGGSVRVPSAVQGLYGLRPTLRLLSQNGIVPLAHSQDTAGPMCRQVQDCAALMRVMVGYDASLDSGQRMVKAFDAPLIATAQDYVNMVGDAQGLSLDPTALRGARIGVVRELFPAAGEDNRAFLDALEQAISRMAQSGAVIEDVSIDDLEGVVGQSEVNIPGNPGRFASLSAYEFVPDLTHYLNRWGSDADGHPRSAQAVAVALKQHPQEAQALRAFKAYLDNDARAQDVGSDAYRNYHRNHVSRDGYVIPRVAAALDNADFTSGATRGPKYDVLIYPVLQGLNGEAVKAGGNNRLSAFTGFPALALPVGFVRNPVSPSLDQPVALEMLGRPFSEHRLLSLAYGWQQLLGPVEPPASTPEL